MCFVESTDGGDSFIAIKGPANGWEEAGGFSMLDSTSWLYGSASGLHYSSNSGANWEKVGENAWGAPFRADSGSWFLGSFGGVLTSEDGHAWEAIPGSPNATGFTSDGENLYLSYQGNYSGQPFHTAPESDPSVWTNMDSPSIKQGGGSLASDRDHHVVYAACWQGGLWRLTTE